MNKIEYWHDGLSNLLDKFAREVKEGKYQKYSYQGWRDLKEWVNCNRGGSLELAEHAFDVILYIENFGGYRQRFCFDGTDKSLGSFLYNELYEADLKNSVKNTLQLEWNKGIVYPVGYGTVDLDSVKVSTNSCYDNNAVLNINKDDITFKTAAISGSFTEMATNLQTVSDSLGALAEAVDKIKNKDNIIKERKDNEKMKGFNFDFGSCEGSNVRMSMYGLAVMNASGTWVSYDPTTKAIVDVDILNFDGAKYMYKLPVAIKDIKVSDIIIHARKPLFVTEVVKDEKLIAIDPFAGEEKIILPTKNCFGFNFVTKIVNLFDGMVGPQNVDESNPFGNMWVLALMEEDIDTSILPFLLMQQNANIPFNPLMMYALSQKDNKDILPFMLMGQNFAGQNK